MTPDEHIARLDASLAENGEPVRWQRLSGVGRTVVFDILCLAQVRGYAPAELVAGSGITQQDVKMILSPAAAIAAFGELSTTETAASRRLALHSGGALALHSGGALALHGDGSTASDSPIPVRGDRIVRVVEGRPYAVQAATGIYPQGVLVRIELQARGG